MMSEGEIEAPPLELSAAARARHGRLSRAAVEFLELAAERDELRHRATFQAAFEAPLFADYQMHPWPVFVSRRLTREAGEMCVRLVRLLKSVPRRVLGLDAGRLGAFYGLEARTAELATAALTDSPAVEAGLARPDFLLASDGFRCLEANISGMIGGYQTGHFGRAYHAVPALRPFFERFDPPPVSTDALRKMLAHAFAVGLRKFRQPEINVVMICLNDMWVRGFPELLDDYYQGILAALGGFRGRCLVVRLDQLEERGGEVWAGDARVHVLIEGSERPPAPEIYGCWMRGTVVFLNGPSTPLVTDKRNLALLSELADSGIFDAEERRLIERTIPWTRRPAGRAVHPSSPAQPGRDELLERREELVLKPAAGWGGSRVAIGRSTASEAWEAVVDQALAAGDWVAQERVEGVPFLFQAGERGVVPHDVSWSFFVAGEGYAGTLVRLAPCGGSGLLNATQGASISAALEVDEGS